jgi:hypothetical protein
MLVMDDHLPAEQALQVVRPSLYIPATQDWQVAGEVCPTFLLNLPMPHFVQFKVPSWSLYRPTPHSTHPGFSGDDCPFWLLYLPLAQFLQSVSIELPVSSLYLPLPQSLHTLLDVAAGWELHFPVPQFLQLDCPISLLYCPFKQFVQLLLAWALCALPESHFLHSMAVRLAE